MDHGGAAYASFKDSLDTFTNIQARELAELDVWALGRHHGLASILLDWTRSPYVAAFFAFATLQPQMIDPDGNVEVWGISAGSAQGFKQPADFRVVRSSFAHNRRMIAQQGVFTYVWPPYPLETFIKAACKASDAGFGRVPPPLLYRILIPHSQREGMLCHLNRMNINYRTLYPDLDGAANHANFNIDMAGYQGLGSWIHPPGFSFATAKADR